jgi:hypothetical protein
MKAQITPKSRKENLVVQELEKELLIYDLKIDKVLSLNETSALIWQMCDGKNSIGEISNKLSEKLKTQIGEEFIWLALNDLKKENLLINGDEIDSKFEGMSRRQVIRKIGLASMIALPVIASIVAPSSIAAQSIAPGNVALGGSCTSSVECSSAAPNCTGGTCCVSATGNRPGGSVVVNSFTIGACSSSLCTSNLSFNCCSGTGNVSCGPASPSGFRSYTCTCS